ncbi:MAG: transporter ATP-binding protein [Herbinix sp.]|jgi:ABC-type multidrug transport system fused ATPase/permease subunit|nr:transporter ATP-binding protein [Herbinix sp.]
MKQYKRFIQFANNNLFLIFLCFLLNIVSGLCKSVGAIYIQRITDALESNYINQLTKYILIGGILTFSAYIIKWLGAVVPRYLMEKLAYETRISLFKHLQKIPFLTYEGIPIGELQSLIQNDSIKAAQIFYTVLSRILNNLFVFIFSVWAMLKTDKQATFITVTIVIGAIIINQIILRKMKDYEKAAQHSLGAMTQSLECTFKGMETVKTYWAKDFVKTSYLYKQQEYCTNKLKSAQINAIRVVWYTFIENLCLYGSVAYLGYMGISDRMSVGEVVMFIYLIKQIIMPIEVIFRWMSTLVTSSACWERILNKLNIKSEAIDSQNYNLPLEVENVKIEDLTFSYDNSPPIINNLSLYLEKGKITGLFGTSGTGKTTLLKIISGLYISSKAIYKINGNRIDTLRPYITYTSLEKSIFPMTIYENIALGDDNVNPEEVKNLLFELGFERWISSLPDGIETIVKNEDMSGGQKQAISTARALLCHKPVVILDEPFSALDSKNEEFLSDVLKKEKRNKIILITSHRSDKTNLFDLKVML